ncbi:hypothetical protein [Nannocystis bainbridge]|uniref:Uncharacterized protein n=1 Tax=Nannocystis bainbridge TaxID=2995303 RepID=A0ABT5DWZ1_9BACT|nr:hypothetical protein [Nannocystis bainbridge]MDC0718099.1 hypothetical protein [Nannocystis bainbridge]
MHDHDHANSLSIGGPNGIRISAPAAPARRTSDAPTRLADPRTSVAVQRGLAAHGRLIVGGVAILGGVVLLSWLALVSSLALPGLLVLPGVVAAAALWIAAAVIHVIARDSRRSLAAAREQRILALAARTPGPLTVVEVARALDLSLADAEAALTAMSRGGHMDADIDLDSGRLQFSLAARPASLAQDLRP